MYHTLIKIRIPRVELHFLPQNQQSEAYKSQGFKNVLFAIL